MDSVWRQTAELSRRGKLLGDRETEVVVIGAGMAGVLIARELGRRGIETLVLEARSLGSGQTQNTTAKVTAQHGMVYQRLVDQFGEELARQYAQANQRAVENYRRMVREEDIDCDWTECPAYLYSKVDARPLEREAEVCRRMGLDTSFTMTTTLPFAVKGAVRMEGQAMFHPLKFLKAAARDLDLYEGSPVTAVRGDQVVTPGGRVKAKHIVFACHYPFVNLPGLYFTRMHQERSYVVGVQGAAELDGAYYGVDPGALSLRNWGKLLLVGGGGHRTGKNGPGGQYKTLEDQARALWSDCRPVVRWSAQDCATLDGVPYIGPFSPTKPRWYVATGFDKWGMTTSMAAAELLADQICGRENPLAPVFSPRRFSGTAAKNLMLELGEAAKNLSKANFSRPDLELDELPAGHGAVVRWQGKRVGAYREEDGRLHLVDPRCPHLGCLLAWNPEEKTWDCPCHGSRFDYEGNLLNNPAQTDL